jgi:hypothetical protein
VVLRGFIFRCSVPAHRSRSFVVGSLLLAAVRLRISVFRFQRKVSPPSSQLHRTESFFLPMFLLIARESIEVASLVSGQGSIFFGVYTIRLVASAPAWIRERVPPQSRWLSSLA